MKLGTRVYVSTDYLYVRVASEGTVEDWRPGKKLALINIDYMDGFFGCCELVPKKDIRNID